MKERKSLAYIDLQLKILSNLSIVHDLHMIQIKLFDSVQSLTENPILQNSFLATCNIKGGLKTSKAIECRRLASLLNHVKKSSIKRLSTRTRTVFMISHGKANAARSLIPISIDFSFYQFEAFKMKEIYRALQFLQRTSVILIFMLQWAGSNFQTILIYY